MVRVDESHKVLEAILDLLVLHVHSSKPVTSLTVRIEWSLCINQSKMLSLQQALHIWISLSKPLVLGGWLSPSMTQNSDSWSGVTHPLDSYPQKKDQMYKMPQRAKKKNLPHYQSVKRTNELRRRVRCHQSTYTESRPLTFLSNSLQHWDVFLVDASQL